MEKSEEKKDTKEETKTKSSVKKDIAVFHTRTEILILEENTIFAPRSTQ